MPDILTALGVTDAPAYPEERYDLIWTVSDSKFSPTVQPVACTEPKVYDQVPATAPPVSESIPTDAPAVPTDVQRISEAPAEREAERATEQASIGV